MTLESSKIVKMALVSRDIYKVDAQVWELKKNNDGIKVYTKKNKQSPFDLLKAECEISVSVDQMLNLI